MPSLLRTAPLAGLLALLAAGTTPADEVSDQQVKVAKANLGKAEIVKTAVVETENLIVCGPITPERAKAVGAALQKTYKLARKGLQFEEKEEPWKGKLTVYVIPDKREFNQFMRAVAGARPEVPEFVSIRGDEPFVVCGSDPGERTTDADVAAEVAPLIGAALLMSKAGPTAPVPGWVRSGFGRAAALRAAGTSSPRFTTYKGQARTAVLGGKGKGPAPLAEVWGADRSDGELLGTALLDYMAFGPGAANFPRFVSGLRADENGDAPSMRDTLESAGWKEKELEAGWRKWVQSGMQAK